MPCPAVKPGLGSLGIGLPLIVRLQTAHALPWFEGRISSTLRRSQASLVLALQMHDDCQHVDAEEREAALIRRGAGQLARDGLHCWRMAVEEPGEKDDAKMRYRIVCGRTSFTLLAAKPAVQETGPLIRGAAVRPSLGQPISM
jgi:hypothetical protein